MGTAQGWMTRRANQAQREKEWDDAIFEAGKAEAREALRPLLELCGIAIAGPLSDYAGYDLFLARREAVPEQYRQIWDLAADLRRELGREPAK